MVGAQHETEVSAFVLALANECQSENDDTMSTLSRKLFEVQKEWMPRNCCDSLRRKRPGLDGARAATAGRRKERLIPASRKQEQKGAGPGRRRAKGIGLIYDPLRRRLAAAGGSAQSFLSNHVCICASTETFDGHETKVAVQFVVAVVVACTINIGVVLL